MIVGGGCYEIPSIWDVSSFLLFFGQPNLLKPQKETDMGWVMDWKPSKAAPESLDLLGFRGLRPWGLWTEKDDRRP